MSAGAAARAAAARIVTAVVERGHSLDRALADELGSADPERSSIGLVRLLSYESLRWYLRLEALLERWIKPGQRLDAEVRSLAIVGLSQVFHTDVPPYAAVSSTVEATRLLRQPKAAGLINAVLRRAQREGATVLCQVDRDPALRTAHPPWLVQWLREDWPTEWERILDANNGHPPFWLRVNRRRMSRDDYRAKLASVGIESDISEFASDALRLAEAPDLNALPGFRDGEVSVQDAAAQLAAEFIQPRAGERVLDACAAPGGKACHLLEHEPSLKELVAVDVSPDRLLRVTQNLERLSLSATLIAGDVGEPAQWWDGELFDRVLLDVPCSATGVIRRHPDIKLLRRRTDMAPLAARQRALLKALWPLVKPGGRLVYASCSALRVENATVIDEFLRQTPTATDRTSVRAQELGLPAQASTGYAITAGAAGMDGFYYACLQKT
jgi:16S rRNA (cytosine967-C5)-methyltransferase